MLRYISASLKGNLFSGETMHSNCKPQRSRSSCQKFPKKSGFKRGIFLIFLSLRPTENSVGKIYCNLSGAFKFFLSLFSALLTNLSCFYKPFFVLASLWSSRIDDTTQVAPVQMERPSTTPTVKEPGSKSSHIQQECPCFLY